MKQRAWIEDYFHQLAAYALAHDMVYGSNIEQGVILMAAQDGQVQEFALRAQKRGVIFDVGHGGGSFRYSQAIAALKGGLKPNTISTVF